MIKRSRESSYHVLGAIALDRGRKPTISNCSLQALQTSSAERPLTDLVVYTFLVLGVSSLMQEPTLQVRCSKMIASIDFGSAIFLNIEDSNFVLEWYFATPVPEKPDGVFCSLCILFSM